MKTGKINGAASSTTSTTSPRSASNNSNPSLVIGLASVQEKIPLPTPPPAEKVIKKQAPNNKNISNKIEKKQPDKEYSQAAAVGFKNPPLRGESTLVEFDRFSTYQADEIGDKKQQV